MNDALRESLYLAVYGAAYVAYATQKKADMEAAHAYADEFGRSVILAYSRDGANAWLTGDRTICARKKAGS